MTRDPIPKADEKGQWIPVAYTESEGGEWIKIIDTYPDSYAALQYKNGWIFDSILKALGHTTCWRRIDDNPLVIYE